MDYEEMIRQISTMRDALNERIKGMMDQMDAAYDKGEQPDKPAAYDALNTASASLQKAQAQLRTLVD